MSTNLMAAHNQWQSRPSDERFWNINELGTVLTDTRQRSYEREKPGRQVRAAVQQYGNDGADLVLTAGGSGAAKLTNWSFNQLCTYAAAPSSYLRMLPPTLAAECLNNGLAKRGDDSTNLLLHRNGEGDSDFTLRSITTDKYSRLWNSDIVKALQPATERGWMTPPARPSVDDERARPATIHDIIPGQDDFGLSVKVGDMIAPAGVYASDRDVFIFLVNPERIIDDGVKGLMRGVFIWNSEVGAGAFKVQAFYLENVCGNHIVWNASGVKSMRVVHKGNAIKGVGYRMGQQLAAFANLDTSSERGMIRAARQHVLGADRKEVVANLYNNKSLGLSQGDIEAAYTVAEEWEHTAAAPPNTAWGWSHGATRFSQTMHHTDARTKLDAAAGRVLELAAKTAGVNTKLLALPAPR